MRTVKYPIILLAGMLLYSCSSGKKTEGQQIPIIEGYTLLWSDEFDVDGKPDAEYWSYERGFVRNEELQWYQEENASVKNGLLTITGRREKIENPNYDSLSTYWKKNRKHASYTSSSINTAGKLEFQYGIIEVRAKIDTASGMWPAIWTLGTSRPWPANGEVDIMEYYRIENEPHILANAAWKGKNEVMWDSEKIPFQHFLKKDANWPEKFHIWKMDWNETLIRLYLDGELINEVELGKTVNPDGFNPFHQPHYILLNLAIGSNGGNPSTTLFPKIYQVDYVRVYQKNKTKNDEKTN